MRLMLATAIFMAGCLHAQAPKPPRTDPSILRAFTLLVSDEKTIGEAKVFADKHALTPDALGAPVLRAYEGFMRREAYVPAAEIAFRFGLGKAYGARPMALQHEAAADAVGRFLFHKDDAFRQGAGYQAAQELGRQAVIACHYSADPKDGRKAVSEAVGFRLIASDDSVLYPLLDAGCPVDDDLRDRTIAIAYVARHDDFAIRHAARAGWSEERKFDFVWNFFQYQRCGAGFKAVTAMRIASKEVIRLVESSQCDAEDIDSSAWALSMEDASTSFFAAVRKDKCNLALELLPHGNLGEDGEIFLFQEAFRHGGQYEMLKAIRYHPKALDPFMRYAFAQGRFRFIAASAPTFEWQRKGFDKLLELGKWEDAAEAAEYGFGEAFRSEGVVLAFRAAMAAGDFKAGRYFVLRYGPVKEKPGLVTRKMYDEEQDKFYAAKQAAGDPEWMKEKPAKPKPKRKTKRQRPKPSCPDDDWCP